MNSTTTSTLLLTFIFPLLGPSGELTGKVSVASGGSGRGAIVYVLAGLQPNVATPQLETAQWTIHGGQLNPQVFVAQAGKSFTITNLDAVGYNVQVRFRNRTECNHALRQKGQTSITAEKPELFARVTDDLGRLHGYVCVLEHRVYALTDATGSFKLPDLPEGTYTIEAAHPREGRFKREITISHTNTVLDFTLPGREKGRAQ